MYCFRERETILSLFEEVTGCRFHYNTHAVGGNRHDITPKFSHDTKTTIELIEKRIEEYVQIFSSNRIYRDRTQGVGVLDGDLAVSLGITGPLARASGVDHDLRRDAPYHIYGELDVNVFTESAGDCFARTQVRLNEMYESIRIVREIIDSVPEGPILGIKPGKSPTHIKIGSGQHYTCIESPRGELGTYLIGGGGNRGASAYRLKIRSPSLHAVSCIPYVFPGHTVSDAIAILGTLDPIMGEVDR
jgi:NADH-quinone oxidoreductase subunit D